MNNQETCSLEQNLTSDQLKKIKQSEYFRKWKAKNKALRITIKNSHKNEVVIKSEKEKARQEYFKNYLQAYYSKNKELLKQKQREYYFKNKEKRSEYAKNYYRTKVKAPVYSVRRKSELE